MTIREALFPDKEPTFRGNLRDVSPELWPSLQIEPLDIPSELWEDPQLCAVLRGLGFQRPPTEIVPGDDVVDAVQEKEKSRWDVVELDLSDQSEGEERLEVSSDYSQQDSVGRVLELVDKVD